MILTYSVGLDIWNNYFPKLGNVKMAILTVGTCVTAGLLAGILVSDKNRLTKGETFLADLKARYLFLGALLLRVGWILVSDVQQTSDYMFYNDKALDILHNGLSMNPDWPTGPSLFIALHYFLFGYNTVYPQLSNALLSATQVFLLYSLLVHLTDDRRAAAAGGLLLACWPEHLLYTNLLGSDTLFSTGLLMSVWLISAARRSAGPASFWMIYGAGASLGLAHWMRATAPLFAVIVGAFLCLRPGERLYNRAIKGGMLAAGFGTLVLPTVVFNYQTYGIVTINASQAAGWSLMMGTNNESGGAWNAEDVNLFHEELGKAEAEEGEHPAIFRNRVARQIAMRRIAEDPTGLFFTILRYKVSNLWGNAANLKWSLRTSRLAQAENYIWAFSDFWHKVALIACAVILFRRRRQMSAWDDIGAVYIFCALAKTLIHLVFEVQPRYHHMFIPLFCITLAGAFTQDRTQESSRTEGQ